MKPKREDYQSDADYIKSLENYVNIKEKNKTIIRTFSMPIETYERLESYCQKNNIKKSRFIVTSIDEKLKSYEADR